jgi:hypothetical protein
LIKAPILDQLLADWFTKLLFPPIALDVVMGNVVTEEKAIISAHYLDLLYSQFDTLYDLIPHAPHPSNDPTKHALVPNFVSNTTTTSTPSQTSNVNVVQSTSSSQPGGKKKNKGKSKKYSNEQDNPKIVDTQLTMKDKSPYMIYEEDHYMKDYFHHEVIAKFMKDTSQPVQQHLLSQNISPPQGGNAGHSHHGDASLSASQVYMFNTFNVTTRENTYDTLPSDNTKGKVVYQPSTSTSPPYSNPLQIEKPISNAVLRSPKSII